MQVSVESVGALERRMKVQVPAERIDSEVDNRLERVGRTAKIKGFRPGKVPMKVIRQRYGGQVRQEVLSEVMQSSFYEAVSREQLRPAGGPHIHPEQVEHGRDLEYTATFEVYPEVELSGHEGLRIEKPAVEVGESDVDEMMENLRRQRAQWDEVERGAAEPDRVTVDFQGTLDGKPFAHGSGEDVQVELGRGQMLADFEDGITGMAAGEERDIRVTFPENYGAAELAGKTADFHVRVKKVEARRLPEVDDEFARSFGIEEGVEKLRDEVRENMRQELEDTIRNRLREQVLEGLVQANELELPKVLVEGEIQAMREAAVRRLGVEIKDASQLPPREPFEEQARRRVKLGLLVAEVIRQAEIQLDRQRVNERIRETASRYGNPDEIVQLYTGNRQLMERLEMEVMEAQVVDWLLERARITDKAVGFKEFMDRA